MLLVGMIPIQEWTLETSRKEGHVFQVDFNQQELLGVDNLNVAASSLTLAQEASLNIYAKPYWIFSADRSLLWRSVVRAWTKVKSWFPSTTKIHSSSGLWATASRDVLLQRFCALVRANGD